MINIEKVKKEIIEKLLPLNPYKVVLFGSYAYGKPNDDSDLDLYIVTNDDFIPQNWREKADFHLTISRALRDIIQKYPSDLITHTKKMHEKFIEQNSSFSKTIMNDGVLLYG